MKFILLFLAASFAADAQFTIDTVAGRYLPLPGTNAETVLISASRIAVDGRGYKYLIPVTYTAVNANGSSLSPVYGPNQILQVDPNNVVTGVFGTTEPGFSGDGGPATAAQFYYPAAIVADAAGNLYISDTGNARIRKIDIQGNISTICGTGIPGFSGDGGPATAAQVSGMFNRSCAGVGCNSVNDLAIDASGNLYLADTGNTRVRKISNGTITTVAGVANPNGVSSGDGGQALSANILPFYVSVDSAGDILISETSPSTTPGGAASYSLRFIDHATHIIKTIPIDATWGFFHGRMDGAGRIYFTSFNSWETAILSTDITGAVTVFAGSITYGFSEGLAAAQSTFTNITDLAFDPSNNLFLIEDRFNPNGHQPSSIQRIDAIINLVSTVSGDIAANVDGPALNAPFFPIGGLAVDAKSNLYLSESPTITVRRIDSSTGSLSEIAQSFPGALATDGQGNLYLADYMHLNTVSRIDTTTGSVTAVAGNGVSGYSGDGGLATVAELNQPSAMAFDSSGNLYILDWGNSAIRKVDATTGKISTILRQAQFPSLAGGAASIPGPGRGVLAVDQSANVYVAIGGAIVKLTPAGVVSIYAGNGTATGEDIPALGAQMSPKGLTLDADGYLYYIDDVLTFWQMIRRINPTTGTVSTVVGSPFPNYAAGDGGPALLASLTQNACCLTSDGHNIYYAESANASIRKISAPAGTTNPPAPSYTGNLDSASCTAVSGWAADRSRPGQSIAVSIYDDASGAFVAYVPANLSRPDVGAVVGDNGLHGFHFVLDTTIFGSGYHNLRVVFETNTGLNLAGSPKGVNCGTNYVGHVDTFSCSAISGWAADLSRLNGPIEVTLWDGAAQIASQYALASRPDVGTAIGDNGFHGFIFTIPASYADGKSHSLEVHYESSPTKVPGSPVTQTCGPPASGGVSYVGSVDSATCNGINGWVADRSRLNTPITVSLWDGATQIASTTANASRPDVGTFLGDNGLHGFWLQLPSSYANGASHTLQVHYESSASQVGAPVTLTCGLSSGGVRYAGSVDSASCSGINGWVADRNRLNTAITVSLWDGSTQIASATANGSRPDVGTFLGDNGLHGFSLQLPSSYVNGVSHTLQVHYESSASQVGAPVTLTCGLSGGVVRYAGSVDSASCSGVNGWVADRNRLNTAITVSLWDGSTQIASTTANGSRPDVGTFLGDNGFHGFTLQLPSSYVNGVSHTLQVHYESSATAVGSAVTLTCGSPTGGAPNYAGFVDSYSCSSGINGWAADRNRLNTAIVVSLWDPVAQSVIASTAASGSRSDVGAFLGDNGLHGYSLQLPVAYANGVSHVLQVRFETSTTQLTGSPVTMTCGSSGTANYAGNVDISTCSTIAGWAADRNGLNTSVSVGIYDGSTLVSTILSNGSRPDVGTYLGDNGLHGFSVATPASIKDGVPHIITVRPGASSTPLAGPQTLTCQ